MTTQISRFAVVGALSTLVHLGLFATLSGMGAASQAANLVALLLATATNTAANRRWTFGVRGRGAGRHHLQGYVLFAVTGLFTAAGLAAVGAVAPGAGTTVRTAAVGAMTGVAAVARFVAMRAWMFRGEEPIGEAAGPEPAGVTRPAGSLMPHRHQ